MLNPSFRALENYINHLESRKAMNGVISNFRQGRHTIYHNQLIVHVDGVEDKTKASTLVGKKVTWTSSAGKKLTGEVRSAHGNKGAVRVLFETGMPGQSLGTKVSFA